MSKKVDTTMGIRVDTPFSEYTWEQLVEFKEKCDIEKDNLEAALEVISSEMVLRLEEENLNGGKIVGDKTISKVVTYTTDKETAKELGAITVVTQERINTSAIKELYLKGIEIKNLIITKRAMVRNATKKED